MLATLKNTSELSLSYKAQSILLDATSRPNGRCGIIRWRSHLHKFSSADKTLSQISSTREELCMYETADKTKKPV